MLTKEANQRLIQVGPGTPGGNLLRRYWHPVATSSQLAEQPVLQVKLLGENLALYRSPKGEIGLIAQRCPHRGASLAYGIPEEGGLRCPYHGWKFDAQGQCIEQPAEPRLESGRALDGTADSTFRHRVRTPAYPVQELGGLIFAYLGPEPAPLVPRWDIFVREDWDREIGLTYQPCNWVQMMENSMDPVHLEFLHTRYMNYVLGRQGRPPVSKPRHHVNIAFDVFEYGISKRRFLDGDTGDEDHWRVGHPIIFPNILAIGDDSCPRFEIRVPLDDEYLKEDGRLVNDNVLGQDMLSWLTQGTISDRSTERLGWSDKGVILFRSVMFQQMERVARGEDPLGVVRDPEKNQLLTVPREHKAFYTPTGEMVIQHETDDPLDIVRTRSTMGHGTAGS